MDVLKKFDPWGDPLCTCPPKYGLNPYTGCEHRCVYCYITSYIPHAFKCRPKKDLIKRLEKDLAVVDKRMFVSMSNSSDPYPPQERRLFLTRKCLEILLKHGMNVQIITKSDLVVRDCDILSEGPSVVSFTITTLDERVAKKLEPGAPSPKNRLKAMQKLSAAGIPVTLRLDPIIPGLNDDEIEKIVWAAVEAGAKHVTSSTFKPRPDSWSRFSLAFPEEAKNLHAYFFEHGWKHHNARYLPRKLRKSLMERVEKICVEEGVTFASCREGFSFKAPTCDGSHLLKSWRPVHVC
ncbi:MAG: radical SAM protein [Candidatus Hadarchaeales archaeon]